MLSSIWIAAVAQVLAQTPAEIPKHGVPPESGHTVVTSSNTELCAAGTEQRFNAFRCLKTLGASYEELATVVDPDGTGTEAKLGRSEAAGFYSEQSVTERILSRMERFPQTFRELVSNSAGWVRYHQSQLNQLPEDQRSLSGDKLKAKKEAAWKAHVELVKALNGITDFIANPDVESKESPAIAGIVHFLKQMSEEGSKRTEEDWRQIARRMMKEYRDGIVNGHTLPSEQKVFGEIKEYYRAESESVDALSSIETIRKNIDAAKRDLARRKPDAVRGLKACGALGNAKISQAIDAALAAVEETPLTEIER